MEDGLIDFYTRRATTLRALLCIKRITLFPDTWARVFWSMAKTLRLNEVAISAQEDYWPMNTDCFG